MSMPSPIGVVPEQDGLTDASSQPREERMIAHRPAQARTERRFEIGFFIRKVVNGWLAYYKQFPPQRQPVSGLEAPPEDVVNQGSASGGSHAMALARSRSGRSDEEVHAQDSPGVPSGDTGPVGSTRFEVGFFVSTTTESTGDNKT